MTLSWKWMLENSDAKAVTNDALSSAQYQRALTKHYGAAKLRAMREYANLARSPEDGWRAAVQAVRDGDPSMMLE